MNTQPATGSPSHVLPNFVKKLEVTGSPCPTGLPPEMTLTRPA